MASMVPVELFSITMSAVFTSSFSTANPSGILELTPKLRLVRLDEANDAVISVPMTSRMKSG